MNNRNVLFEIKGLNKMILSKFDKVDNNLLPSPTQMQIFHFIMQNRDKTIYQRDLEELLGLRRATVSGVLRTMEKNDLISRVVLESDTRSKKIILNNKALKLLKEKDKIFNDIANSLTINISEEEIKIFLNVIKKMKENLNK